MVDITRIELSTQYPFHFGRRGVGLNETDIVLEADALFSALCNSLALLESAEAVTAFLRLFPTVDEAKTPPFRLTSLMPSAAGIDFLPMPHLRLRLPNMGLESRKDFKSLAWVSHAVFQRLVKGEELDDAMYIDPVSKRPYTVQDGEVWLTRNEQTKLGNQHTLLWKIQTRPRVTVDRMSSKAAAYSSGTVCFAPNVQLYTLIHWENADETLRQRIYAAFVVLGDEGVGGERAYGYGKFDAPKPMPYTLELGATQGSHSTTLAPYLPQVTEQGVFGTHSSYAIALRRGWMSRPGYTTLRRPTVRMLEKGSILTRPANGEIVGALGDATPQRLRQEGGYSVYRYGLAWPVTLADAALNGATTAATAKGDA